MQVSQKTEYALKTILDLAQHADQSVVPTAHIAKRQDIPVKFLEQILIVLKGSGVVGSRRGPKGGYYLQRSPSEITVGSLVRLTESHAAAIAPDKGQTQHSYCPFSEVWQQIEHHIHSTLEGLTIQDMCDRARERAGNHTEYVI